jgi:DNA-binding response OmpR family regulator
MATVLVIEDDPDIREIEKAVLGCAGHEVITAANGLAGLQLLERKRPCLILLDLMMPVMDGLTFLVEKAKRTVAREVPVLCVSAGGDNMIQRALELGATDCLMKPADFDELCGRVAQFCTACR